MDDFTQKGPVRLNYTLSSLCSCELDAKQWLFCFGFFQKFVNNEIV